MDVPAIHLRRVQAFIQVDLPVAGLDHHQVLIAVGVNIAHLEVRAECRIRKHVRGPGSPVTQRILVPQQATTCRVNHVEIAIAIQVSQLDFRGVIHRGVDGTRLPGSESRLLVPGYAILGARAHHDIQAPITVQVANRDAPRIGDARGNSRRGHRDSGCPGVDEPADIVGGVGARHDICIPVSIQVRHRKSRRLVPQGVQLRGDQGAAVDHQQSFIEKVKAMGNHVQHPVPVEVNRLQVPCPAQARPQHNPVEAR